MIAHRLFFLIQQILKQNLAGIDKTTTNKWRVYKAYSTEVIVQRGVTKPDQTKFCKM